MTIERTTSGPELLLGLTREPGRTFRGQLEQHLRAAVRSGRLPVGSRLPSSRTLAADLGVSRGLVVEAYAQLVGEGYLEARPGSGTRVAAGVGRERPAAGGDVAVPPRLPIDFRPGLPDLTGFPRAAWASALRRALAEAPAADLGYAGPGGAPALRAALAGYLARVRGVEAGPGDVVVTAGYAQGLAALARVLPGRYGTRIGVEDPGSPGTRDSLARAGLDPVPVRVDAQGLVVEELAASGVRAVVVSPAHQFPTGVVLAPGRRTALLAWAATAGGLVVEDDYDAEYRYDREPVGALQGLAPDLVLYGGSVSKTLAPALRLGWLVASRPPLRAAVASARHDLDLGSPVLDQLALAGLVASGGFDRHVRRSRASYRRRRDALVAALGRHAPALQVRGTAAGLHAVVDLPAGTDEAALVRRAAAAGVGVYGMADYHAPGRSGPPGLVLGYACLSDHEIDSGVRTLAGLLEPGAADGDGRAAVRPGRPAAGEVRREPGWARPPRRPGR
jgi:GntR family transcriptional regulator/MocR family aminotransferase